MSAEVASRGQGGWWLLRRRFLHWEEDIMSCDIRSEFRGDDVVITGSDPLFSVESLGVYNASNDEVAEVNDPVGDLVAALFDNAGWDDDEDWDDDAPVYVDTEGDYDDDAVTEAGW